jgi:hypothetical protein
MSLTGTATPDETAELLAFFAPAAVTPQPVTAVTTITPIPADPLQVRNSEDIRAAIIELLAGGTFLREIARMPGMPSTQAIRNWRKADPDFDKEIEAARLEGTDAIFESSLQIADDGRNDYIDVDGVRRVDTDHIQRSKLRVDTRMRLAEKMNPKKYGAKVDVNHGGQEGNPVRLIAANMTQEESTQLYSEMLKVGRT